MVVGLCPCEWSARLVHRAFWNRVNHRSFAIEAGASTGTLELGTHAGMNHYLLC